MRRWSLAIALLWAGGALFAADPPAWWSASETRILDANATPSNYSPVLAGQLKHAAKQAKKYLDANVVGGAGPAINTMVAGFTPQSGVAYTPEQLAVIQKANYTPVNLGQLKAVAKPFYDRLKGAGYNAKQNLIDRGYASNWSYDYPWNPNTPAAQNYKIANLGQLKMAFSFDLRNLDFDSDGIPDWWEQKYFSSSGLDGQGDPDGDELENLEEYQQGSNPTDYYNGKTPVVAIIDGNGQSGSVSSFLVKPLVIKVTNSAGNALVGAPVTFQVSQGNGKLATSAVGTPDLASTLSLRTDAGGKVSVYFKGGESEGKAVLLATAATATQQAQCVFTETILPGADLKLWLKADALAQSNGTGMAQWSDQSGNGNHAIQATAAKQPKYQLNVLNGKPVVRFDGSDDQLAVNRVVQDDLTMVVVFKSSQGLGTGTQWGEGAGLVDAAVNGLNNDFGLSLNAQGRVLGGVGSSINDTSVYSGAGYNDGKAHVAIYRRVKGTGELKLYVDGVLQPAAAGGTHSLTAPTRMTIGSIQTNQNYLSGDIAEVLVYGRALADHELQWVEFHLGNKYNLAAVANQDWNEFFDAWEMKYFGHTGVNAAEDGDGDEKSNLDEYQEGSDPTDYYNGQTPGVAALGGNNQSGPLSAFLTYPFTVKVSDSAGNPLKNAPVTFTMSQGAGKLALANTAESALVDTLSLRTDGQGLAQVYYRGADQAEVAAIQAVAGTAPLQAQALFTAGTVPADVLGGGLKLWLKADAVAQSSGTGVAQWSDQSGNNHHAIQATAAKQPKYQLNVLNGKPVVRFDGIDDQLAVTRVVQDDFTIAVLFKSSQGVGIQTKWWAGAGLVDAEVGGPRDDFGLSLNANGQVLGGTGGENLADTFLYSGTGYNNGQGRVAVFRRVKATGALELYVDGILQATAAGGTQPLDEAQWMMIGSIQTSMNYLQGDIAEVVVYEQALMPEDQRRLEIYLGDKYSLPALRDTDDNGLPDQWEDDHFEQLGVNPNADADGDGLTNLEEFQQSGDPRDYYRQGRITITPLLAVVGGNNQSGRASDFLASELEVSVVNAAGGAPLRNAPVTFKVTQGDAKLAPSGAASPLVAQKLVRTGADGHARVRVKLGTAFDSRIQAQTGTAEPVIFSALGWKLLGQWTFEKDSAGAAYDVSGQQNHATKEEWAGLSASGGALSFSGTSGYLQTPVANQAQGALMAWIYPRVSTAAPAFQSIFDSDVYGQFGTGWGLNNGMITVLLDNLVWNTGVPVEYDKWQHVALVYDASSAKLYVNGLVKATCTYTQGAVTPANYRIGRSNAYAHYFDGKLDDVRIYSGTLLAMDVALISGGDADGDGFSNAQEVLLGTNYQAADTDGDGLSDGEEAGFRIPLSTGTDPTKADSDGNGINDGQEFLKVRVGISDYDLYDDIWDVYVNGIWVVRNVATFKFMESKPAYKTIFLKKGTTAKFTLGRPDLNQLGSSDEYHLRFENPAGAELPIAWQAAPGNSPLISAFYYNGDTPPDPSALKWNFYISDSNDGDADGLDANKENSLGTDPADPDTDHDGMPDGWEVDHSLNPRSPNDAPRDADGDGVTNLEEYRYEGDPHDGDADGDGLPDLWEMKEGAFLASDDAAKASYHHNGLRHLEQFSKPATDTDGDGLSDYAEGLWQTQPGVPDTDGDGMPDGYEVANGLNPKDGQDALADKDNDGVANLAEYQAGTLGWDYDTDNDGLSDGWERQYGTPAKSSMEGLQAWWRMDHGPGYPLYDTSGNRHDGEWHGDASLLQRLEPEIWAGNYPYRSVSAWDRSALVLRGAHSFVTVPEGEGLVPSGSCTWAFEVNPDDVARERTTTLFEKEGSYAVRLGSDRKLEVELVGKTGVRRKFFTAGALAAGQWTSVGIVLDAGNPPKVRLYLNGVMNSEASLGEAELGKTDRALILGSARIEPPMAPQAQLDDLRFYGRTLSAAELAGL
ncbi:MAG TPA: LamG-like jellyroll fold domain-containing protein, partial [Chthoniobacterales bacterium]